MVSNLNRPAQNTEQLERPHGYMYCACKGGQQSISIWLPIQIITTSSFTSKVPRTSVQTRDEEVSPAEKDSSGRDVQEVNNNTNIFIKQIFWRSNQLKMTVEVNSISTIAIRLIAHCLQL